MSTTQPSNNSGRTSDLGLNTEFSIVLPDANPTNKVVPNQLPVIESQNRIMVIGGWPDYDSATLCSPFSGAGGSMLFNSLRRFGISKAHCALCYVSAIPLSAHKKHWTEPSVHSGLEALKATVDEHRPNIILLLGDTALQAAWTDGSRKVEQWRGSLMRCDDEKSAKKTAKPAAKKPVAKKAKK